MFENPTTRMANYRSQYLGIYRLLLVMLAILVPIFSFTISFFQEKDNGILLLREIMALTGLGLFIGTYKSSWIRRNIQYLMISLYVVLYLWQYLVLIIHDFHQNSEISFLIIVTSICIGFEDRVKLIRFMIVSCTVTVLVILFGHHSLGEAIVFAMTYTAICLILLLINLRKFSAEKEVVRHANELKEKNQEILDSINYAKRIQSAILPPDQKLFKSFNEVFVIYKPKDIVAGDFYWLEHKDDTTLFAVADCTGHGVPGAMVSVICNNGLNRSVREHGLVEPGAILDKTKQIIIEEFEKSSEEVNDGMDVALCTLKNHELQFSGAHNSLWVIRNSDLIELKGDKQPVGKHIKNNSFTTHSMQVEKGDMIYIFSDGYADQFGGEKNKKFRSSSLKKLLLSVASLPINEQKMKLENTFEEWKGDYEQLDDVCILGVRV